MVTFEEEIVNGYYNLEGYFTIQNYNFPAAEKRKGGKGRGEIDLLAIKIGNDGKVADAKHIEVSVGVYPFPFIDRSKSQTGDEIHRMLKKLFTNDSDIFITKLLGNTQCNSQMITSELNKQSEAKIQRRLVELGAEISSVKKGNNRLHLLGVRYKEKQKDIEICPFSTILSGLKKLFIDNKLSTRDFQNQSLSAVQHLIKFNK